MKLAWLMGMGLVLGVAPAGAVPKPSPHPSAEETAQQEEKALRKAAKALTGFAAASEKAGAGKAAGEAVGFVLRLYPGDPDLVAWAERLAVAPGETIPADLEAKRAQTYAVAAVALSTWGQWLEKQKAVAVADWAYGLAGDLGDMDATKHRERLRVPLEAFRKDVDQATGPPTRKSGYSRVSTGVPGYEYVFSLPPDWSPARPWPALVFPHGTELGWDPTCQQDEVASIMQYESARRAGWVTASYRDPVMAKGAPPDEAVTLQVMDEMVDFLALHYRVQGCGGVFLSGAGTGALCAWAYLDKRFQRIGGYEVSMGKFHGLSKTKVGGAACGIPIRMGVHLADEPNKVVGGHKQSEFDAVHVGQMEAARKAVQKLKFTRIEWVEGEKFGLGQDPTWLEARFAEQRARWKPAKP